MLELSLFSGGGGGLLGSRLLGWRTVCYVEKDSYCQKVIQARIRDGILDDAPIWDDARSFDGRPWAGRVDIISAGFPCQPFSGAGKQLGEDDPRNLWPDTIRIIREVGPEWLLLENVTRLLTFRYFGRILGDLAKSGYRYRYDCIPASAIGANHQRDRLWIVAHASGKRYQSALQHKPRGKRNTKAESGGDGKAGLVANASGQPGGLQLQQREDCFEIGRGSENVAESEGERCGARGTESEGKQGRVGITRSGSALAYPESGGALPAQQPGQWGIPVESGTDVADAQQSGLQGGAGQGEPNQGRQRVELAGGGAILADTSGQHDGYVDGRGTAIVGSGEGTNEEGGQTLYCGEWWAVEPPLGRVADGVANRVAQLRALGNGQVPAVVRAAWLLLSSLIDE